MAKRKRKIRPANPTVDEAKRKKSRGLIHIRNLQTATETIARVLGGFAKHVKDRRKIRVFWTKKEQPYVTADFKICLPIPVEVTEDSEARLCCFRDHEAAHILYTNFSDVRNALDYDGGNGRNLTAKNIHNALEDCRIEAALSRIFAGSGANFAKFWKRNLIELQNGLLARRSFIDQVTVAGIFWVKDAQLPSGLPEITKQGLEIAKPFFKRVVHLAEKQEDIGDTYRKSVACYRIAMGLYDALKQFAEENQDQFQSMEPGDLSGEGEGEAGEGEAGEGEAGDRGEDREPGDKDAQSKKKSKKSVSDGSEFGDASDGDASDGDASDGDASDGDADEDGAGDGEADEDASGGESDAPSSSGSSADEAGESDGKPAESDGSGTTNPYDPDWVFSDEDLTEDINKIRSDDATMETNEENFEEIGRYRHDEVGDDGEPLIPHSDVVESAKQTEGHVVVSSSSLHYNKRRELDDYGRSVAAKSAALARLLMGMDRKWVHRRRLQGRIDDRLLADAALGTTDRIFKNTMRTRADSVAVSLLVDLSGSMGYDSGDGRGKLYAAKKACFALAAVCQRAKVKFEINGYSTSIGGTTLFNAKAFEQTWNDQAKDRVAGFDAKSATPTGEASMIAARRLGQVRADRHILFVITDGEPNDVDYNVAAIDLIRHGGIEIYGFGIEGSYESTLRGHYRAGNYVYCPSCASGLEHELVSLLIGLLKPALLRVFAGG